MKTNIKTFVKKFLVSSCVLLTVSSLLAFGLIKFGMWVDTTTDKLFPAYVVPGVVVVRKVPITVEDKIRAVARAKNFKYADYLVKLAECESRLDPLAIGDQGNSRGLFQIHKKFHPEVSTLQAFNIEYSTDWTIDMINRGEQHQWSCNAIVLAKK